MMSYREGAFSLPSLVLVVHERIGYWGRQLQSRLVNRAVRIVESRSAEDLERVLANMVCSLVVIDLGRKGCGGLDDLGRALRIAPDALVLVIDPASREGIAMLARELGASQVLSGTVTPPEVIDVMTRWISLAQERAKSSGWAGSTPEPPAPEPWNWLTPHIQAWSAEQRPAGD